MPCSCLLYANQEQKEEKFPVPCVYLKEGDTLGHTFWLARYSLIFQWGKIHRATKQLVIDLQK